MRYSLNTLLLAMAGFAIMLGLLRGVFVESAPYWGLCLVALVCICAGIAGVVAAALDPPQHRR